MNSEMGFSLRTPASDGAYLRDDPRGARHWAHLRAAHLYAVGPFGSLTMMQSCASAAKLRAAGPFSPSASVPCQLPVPATSDCQSAVRAERQRERRIGNMMVFRRPFSLPDAR
jgi:hypothetical protein